MKGRVKLFNQDKGYGFILGDDKYDYFFHVSEVKSMDMPTSNSIVEFEESSSEKGRKAINIKVVQKFEQKPEFINLGRHRIKINKIKEYSVSKKSEWECVYDPGFFSLEKRRYANVDKEFYLYITMFDGTYYTVTYQTEEKLKEACKTLDKLLGTINL